MKPKRLQRSLEAFTKGLDRSESQLQQPPRQARERRAYADAPLRYFKEILGYSPSEKDQQLLGALTQHTRVIVELPAKEQGSATVLVSAFILFLFDARAALVRDDFPEQGGRFLLVGPTYEPIRKTIYTGIVEHAQTAQERGHALPKGMGNPGSSRWYKRPWQVEPQWDITAHSQRIRAGFNSEGVALGIHHANLAIVAVDGHKLKEFMWVQMEGCASGEDNKIIVLAPQQVKSPKPIRDRRGQEGWEFVSFL